MEDKKAKNDEKNVEVKDMSVKKVSKKEKDIKHFSAFTVCLLVIVCILVVVSIYIGSNTKTLTCTISTPAEKSNSGFDYTSKITVKFKFDEFSSIKTTETIDISKYADQKDLLMDNVKKAAKENINDGYKFSMKYNKPIISWTLYGSKKDIKNLDKMPKGIDQFKRDYIKNGYSCN